LVIRERRSQASLHYVGQVWWKERSLTFRQAQGRCASNGPALSKPQTRRRDEKREPENLTSSFTSLAFVLAQTSMRPWWYAWSNLLSMNSRLKLLVIPLSLIATLAPSQVKAREPQVEVQQVLQTTKAWDGSDYQSYPTGQPQITVLRIKIPPHTALHWHYHPVISAGYILSGELTVEKQGTNEHITVHAGQALTETVRTTHRGFTTDQPAELVVFYAGQAGLPITVDKEKIE
jgi:quercetin dioxygenase-like cupin family protein